MSDKNNSSFLLGAIIGAALTYLFTTENGKKMKEELLLEAKKVLEAIGENAQEAGEKIEEEKVKMEEIIAEEMPKHIEEIQKKGRRFFFKRSQHAN